MKTIIFTILLISSLFANKKFLILADGNTWYSHTAKNLVKNYSTISQLPFSGFIVVGDSFTNRVMKRNQVVTYDEVWQEVKGLKGLYKEKENFLQINIGFPADFWDDKAWEQVSKNFAVVAKVSRDLGFRGVVFDDEPYSLEAKKMVNYKFPTYKEVLLHPTKYSKAEIKGSQRSWVDKDAYRNHKYSFKEHIEQVTLRFKDIMSEMTKVYPNLVTLVYLGSSLAHVNSNKEYPVVIDMGLERENEFHGAIFTGFEEGLSKEATLYDMGESYKYRKDEHFTHSYAWRKYNIAKDKYNQLDEERYWVVPKSERKRWSQRVNVGFMVFNQGQKSSYKEFTTLNKSTVKDIEQTLYKALKYSDKYAIYYCEKQNWLMPNKKPTLPKEWLEMMKRVYKSIQ